MLKMRLCERMLHVAEKQDEWQRIRDLCYVGGQKLSALESAPEGTDVEELTFDPDHCYFGSCRPGYQSKDWATFAHHWKKAVLSDDRVTVDAIT